MTLNFYNALTLISLFLCIVLSLYFLSSQQGNVLGNLLLFLILQVFALQIISTSATSNWNWMHFMPYHRAIILLRLSAFLLGPLIYAYVKAMNNTPLSRYWLHTLPFAAAIVITCIHFRQVSPYVLWESPLSLPLKLAIAVHNCVYIILAFSGIKRHAKGKELFLRSNAPRITQWVLFIMLAYFSVWLIGVYSLGSYFQVNKYQWCVFTNSLYTLVLFSMLCIMLLLLLRFPNIHLNTKKYRHNSMDDGIKESHLRRLSEYMNSLHPYLNPDIKITDLARELNIPKDQLSQLINESYNTNFRSFINKHRIDFFIQRSQQETDDKVTILEMMYESGFKSKSVFNSSFKQYTGYTPLEYRRRFVLN